MSNKLILTSIIIAVLVLSAIALTFALSYSNNSNNDIFLNQDKNEMQGARYSESLTYDVDSKENSLCNPREKPCFKYEKLEQTRLEPCRPKRVCPLCREQLRQEKGDGHLDRLPQKLTIC